MSLPKSPDDPASRVLPKSRKMRFHLWIGEPLIDLFVECVDDLDRRVLWRTHAAPTLGFIACHEVANRRDVRQCRQPRRGCDRQSAQFASFNVTHRLTRWVKHDLNLSGKQIGERGAGTAIMGQRPTSLANCSR